MPQLGEPRAECECDQKRNGVDGMIDGLIEREGGYREPSRRQGRADLLRDHRGRRPGPWLRRGDAQPAARRSGGDIPPALLARPRFDQVASARHRSRRSCSTRASNMGPAVAADLPAAGADRAQPQRRGLCRPDTRRSRRTARRSQALDAFLAARGRAAARPCCCARSRRSRASATCASPSAARPTRHSSMAGWRTALAQSDENQPTEIALHYQLRQLPL